MAQTFTLRIFNDEYTYATVRVLKDGKWNEIKNNASITDGDTLQIVFGKNANAGSWRKIEMAQVNGIDFQSGGQMTVRDDVEVYVSSSTGTPTEVRGLSPAKPYIGDEVSLDVFETNSRLFCSIKIEAGDMVKYLAPPFLAADGYRYWMSDALNLFNLGYGSQKLKFILPDEIYNSMPIDRIGRIKVTCVSYDDTGKYVVGAPHVEYYSVYAKQSVAAPNIKATVKDINTVTKALTNDENVLIRYMSKAQCEITATAQPLNTTHIAEATVNNYILYQQWDYNSSLPKITESLTLTGNYLTTNEFLFQAISARSGVQAAEKTVTKGWVNYIRPSLNTVEVTRGSGGDNDTVYLDFYGYFYNGNFGTNGVRNSIKVQYRYREDGYSTYSGWSDPISASSILISGTGEHGVFRSGTGSTAGAISISGTFDHTKSYTFQIKVYDGNGTTVLASSTKTANCAPSIPVFDWGKADFNFNVPVKINNVNIFDIVYPIGSVYFCYSNGQPSAPPDAISGIGEWYLVGAAMSNIYAWLRTG